MLTALHIGSDAAFLPTRQATIAYVELFATRPERRAELLQSYHFDINAPACGSHSLFEEKALGSPEFRKRHRKLSAMPPFAMGSSPFINLAVQWELLCDCNVLHLTSSKISQVGTV